MDSQMSACRGEALDDAPLSGSDRDTTDAAGSGRAVTGRVPDVISVLMVTEQAGMPEFVDELAEHGGCRPVGRVTSLSSAAAVLLRRRADVVVVEVDTFDRLHELTDLPEQLPDAAVAVVSALPAEVALLACMATGAAAFVGKPLEPGLLAAAVDAVAQGQTFVDPRSTDWLVRFALHGYKTGPKEGLTLRQAQVVQLVRGGLTNKQIAHALGVSVETVKSHLHEAMRRLGVHDRWNATASLERRRARPGGVSPQADSTRPSPT